MRFDEALAAPREGKKISFPGMYDIGRMLAQDREVAIVKTFLDDDGLERALIWHPEPYHLQMDGWFVIGEDEDQ